MRNTISYKAIDTLPQHSLELLGIEVIPKHAKPFFAVCWYRPPDSMVDKFQDLENVINYLETFQKDTTFLGDTNCNLLEGNSCGSGPAKHMSSFYDSFGFKLLINEPTRVTLDTKTLIDHIATTDPKNIVNSGVIRLGISDHYTVFCVRKFMGKLLKSPKIFVTRQLKNFNKNAFIEALNRVYWDDLLDVDDPTIMVQLWTRVFVGILDRHAPVLKRNGKNTYSPWVTSELIKKRRARDVLKTRVVEMSSEVLMQA